MYSDIIPRLQKLEPKLSAPKTFFSDIEEGVMMMENLKTMGFYIIDKQKGEKNLDLFFQHNSNRYI